MTRTAIYFLDGIEDHNGIRTSEQNETFKTETDVQNGIKSSSGTICTERKQI
jgi:hypothetical protein